jgi:aryl-alcohol dehydrogenase-like predicted oxidoreductase
MKTATPERHIALGKTDLQISPLGIGTWSWGDRLFWSYGSTHTDADVKAAFEASVTAGVNFFDTAETYGRGRSEALLGQLVRGGEGQVVTATKFMPYPWRLRRISLTHALRRSLDRLGLEKVDLYQIHWPVPLVAIETWMEALSDAFEAGLIRAVGVSNYNVSQMRRAFAALKRRGLTLASNQVEFSLLQRKPEHNGLLDACHELGVSLIAYSPLSQGLLTGKYDPGNRPPGLGRRRFGGKRLAAIQPLVKKLREIGEEDEDKTPAQVALNWVICKGAVPIPGAKNAQQASQNAKVMGWRLTDEQISILDEVSAEIQK